MTLRCLGNKVLLAPVKPALVSAGGIALPEQYQDDRKSYYVCAVGPGRVTKSGVLVPPEVAVGERCLVNVDFGGIQFIEDGTGRLMIDAKFVLAKW